MSDLLDVRHDPSDGKFPVPGRLTPRAQRVVRPDHQQAIVIAADVIGTVTGMHGSLLVIQSEQDARRFYGRGEAARGDRVRFDVLRAPNSQFAAAGNVHVVEG